MTGMWTTLALLAFMVGIVGMTIWLARKNGRQETALEAAERMAEAHIADKIKTITTIEGIEDAVAAISDADVAAEFLRSRRDHPR